MLLQLVISAIVVIAIFSLLRLSTVKIMISTTTTTIAAYLVDDLMNLPIVGATLFISSAFVLLVTLMLHANKSVANS